MNTLFVIFPFNTVKFDQSNGELYIVAINMNSLFGTFILVLPNPLSQSNGARGQEVKRCTCQESTRAAYGFLMRLEV